MKHKFKAITGLLLFGTAYCAVANAASASVTQVNGMANKAAITPSALASGTPSVTLPNVAVTLPTELSIGNNQQIAVQLSLSSPNKLQVSGDKIKQIVCPPNACQVRYDAHDPTGSAFVSVLDGSSFTAYVTTTHYRTFSMLVTPFNSPGMTLVFNPVDGAPVSDSPQKGSDYVASLIQLTGAVIKNAQPEGYGYVAAQRPHGVTLQNGLVLKPLGAYVGNAMTLIAMSAFNPTHNPISISESYFYKQGVRSISLSNDVVNPNGSVMVYETVSNPNDGEVDQSEGGI